MGRTDPFATLVQQYPAYLPRVLNYMRLRVGDEAVAQDLTAQTFERALTRLHALRDENAFGGWLFSIARTTVAGYYRRLKPHVSLDALDEIEPNAADDPVERQVEQSLDLHRLRQALQALDPREQEIIRLRFAAGLTNRAIGQALRLGESHVAVILFRALHKLRDMIGEQSSCSKDENLFS